MKKAPYILFVLIALIGLQSTTTRTSQMPDTRSVVKALYIYTFATLVEWPEEKKTGNFIIGVYGDQTAVYDELDKKYSDRYIGSQKIEIRNYYDEKEVYKSHILYVTQRNSQNLPSLASISSKNNVLLVTEQPGGLSSGAVVNFMVQDNQQKYEINKTNARKNNLVIAKKLSNLAAKVVK